MASAICVTPMPLKLLYMPRTKYASGLIALHFALREMGLPRPVVLVVHATSAHSLLLTAGDGSHPSLLVIT